jgi:pimeloyl-ACP methyl ester carboxylesterase
MFRLIVSRYGADVERIQVEGRLDVLVAGPDDGVPLVFHHGTPSGLVPFQPLFTAAAARGLRVVMPARPGYEGSAARPGRSVADIAADVATILDALDAERFVTVGWSGGGPHALACAALLADRCLAAASVAGVAPHDADGLDWPGGMGRSNVEEFGAARAGETALVSFLDAAAAELATVTGAAVADDLGTLISDADKAVLTGEFADHLAAALRAGVSAGVAGWRDDDLAFVRPWGFDLGGLRSVAVWQGDQDRMVPYAHGAWLAERIPAARVRLVPGAGHLTLMTDCARILDDLLDLGART